MLTHLANSAKDWINHSPFRELVLKQRHRGLRQQDCFLASYPKSGNTWLRHVLAHALTGVKTQWQADFREFSVIVGQHHTLIPTLPEGGRLVKTHEPYRDVYRRTILMVRDPRDVSVSQFHYNRQYSSRRIFRECDFATFLDMFIEGTTSLYGDWGSHTRSWNRAIDDQRVVVVRYETMKQDPHAALRSAIEFLGVDVMPERFNVAITDNTAERMREKEKAYRESLATESNPAAQRVFVRAAKPGGWRDYYTPALERKLIDAFTDEMNQHGYGQQQL